MSVTSKTGKDSWIPNFCWNCVEGPCSIRVHVVDGVATNIEGYSPGPGLEKQVKNQGTVCPKPYGMIQKLYNPHRIKSPLKRTNPKKGVGENPGWVEITWDEALNTVAEKLREVRAKDSRRLAVGYGPRRFGADGTWWACVHAFGPTQHLMGGHSIRCDMAEHNFANIIHGGFQCEPDLTYNNYLLLFGSNSAASGGVTENVHFADAIDRGIKRVAIDPILTVTAAKADEWLPIKPGTDLAFILALINVIVNETCIYDVDFIKKMTNSPYLVSADGYFLRDKATGKVLIWDSVEWKAKAYDDASIKDFTLEGTYAVTGIEGKPAFQVLKDHVRQYTPEWAAEITDISALTIRRIAKEFIDKAMIGSTINVGGYEFPYRPVATKCGRGITGVMRSYQFILANHILSALAGALDVPGSHCGGSAKRQWGFCGRLVQEGDRGVVEGADGMLEVTTYPFTWPPVSYGGVETLVPYAKEYGFLTHLGWRNLVNPPKNFPMPDPPEVYIRFRCNPLLSIGEPEIIVEALKKIPFVVSITYVEDEVAPFADILLPDHTELEQYQLATFVRAATATKYFGVQLRQPAVEPLHNTMAISDICTELADRVGFLDEYNRDANELLVLNPPYQLEPGKKYEWVEIVDKHCRSATDGDHDLEWFKENGFILRAATVEEQYGVHLAIKDKGLRYNIPYAEHVKKTGEELRRNLDKVGIDWWSTSEYVPLPTYFPSIVEESPPEYDFYVVNYRSMQFTYGSDVDTPWLIEAARHVRGQDGILVNVEAAKRKGIKEGDEIWIESEVGKVKGKARLCQGIRPDTVGIAGQFGHWATPIAKDLEWPSITPLTPIRPDWTDHVISNLQGLVVKGKIYKD